MQVITQLSAYRFNKDTQLHTQDQTPGDTSTFRKQTPEQDEYESSIMDVDTIASILGDVAMDTGTYLTII